MLRSQKLKKLDREVLRIPLNGLFMQLYPSELKSVAAGLGELDSPEAGDLLSVAEAVRQLPAIDRAPAWELAVRHFGCHKPLAQVAGEIGMDFVLARDLLERFSHSLADAALSDQ